MKSIAERDPARCACCHRLFTHAVRPATEAGSRICTDCFAHIRQQMQPEAFVHKLAVLEAFKRARQRAHWRYQFPANAVRWPDVAGRVGC